MYVAVVARPNPARDFDGRVTMERVAVPYTAKKGSKNHEKGDIYDKDCTFNSKFFRDVMVDKIFPAIVAAFPWCDYVKVQFDNATPHKGGTTMATLNAAGAKLKPRIEVDLQPPNSPDTNTLDLCLFRSWASRNHRLQKFCRAGDKPALDDNVRKSWADYPADLIEKAFQNKSLVMQQIIKFKGGNRFNVPHTSAADRAALPGYQKV